MSYLDQTGEGALLIPNTVALINGGPNPETAKILIDFLLSEETESLLAHSASAQIPVRSQVTRPAHVGSLEDIHHLSVDYESVSKSVKPSSEWVQNKFLD